MRQACFLCRAHQHPHGPCLTQDFEPHLKAQNFELVPPSGYSVPRLCPSRLFDQELTASRPDQQRLVCHYSLSGFGSRWTKYSQERRPIGRCRTELYRETGRSILHPHRALLPTCRPLRCLVGMGNDPDCVSSIIH